MFTQLKKLLSENPDALAELAKVETNYTKLSTEVSSLEAKNTDLISSRDKYKSFTKTAKGTLGFEDGDELSEDVIKSKLDSLIEKAGVKTADADSVSKLEITKLEAILEAQKKDYESQIAELNTKSFKDKLDLRLRSATGSIKATSNKAMEVILSALKDGAVVEGESIVYKDKDGTTVRENGVPVTLETKLESLKADKDYTPFFESEAKSGSGLDTSSGSKGSADTKDLSPQAQAQLAVARRLGIKL